MRLQQTSDSKQGTGVLSRAEYFAGNKTQFGGHVLSVVGSVFPDQNQR